MKVITIKKEDYESIVEYCKEKLPEEACGLIAGRLEGNKSIIEKIYFLTNIEHSDKHFTMEPKEQLAAVKDARAHNMTILGNFHSHPATPARPSAEDIRLAYDSDVIYMILSLMDAKKPVFRGFHIDGEQNVSDYDLVKL